MNLNSHRTSPTTRNTKHRNRISLNLTRISCLPYRNLWKKTASRSQRTHPRSRHKNHDQHAPPSQLMLTPQLSLSHLLSRTHKLSLTHQQPRLKQVTMVRLSTVQSSIALGNTAQGSMSIRSQPRPTVSPISPIFPHRALLTRTHHTRTLHTKAFLSLVSLNTTLMELGRAFHR